MADSDPSNQPENRFSIRSGIAANILANVLIAVIFFVSVPLFIRYLGVDGSLDRGNQTGYVVEGGVRFEGRAGAIELFVAGERRIDPYPVEVGTAQWLKAGFRLLSR